MSDILNKISEIGIVPVVVIDDANTAVDLANAMVAGDIPVAEVTFRTEAAEQAMKNIKANCPDMILGAGTVLTTEQVDAAVEAGAQFIVSPGINPNVVKYCVDRDIPIVPGCANPSNVETALEFGLDTVKFFPAEQAGGLNYIKAIAAPYTTVRFMPTGGINPENVKAYLGYDRIIACGGSWMVKKDLIANGQFDEITRMCKEARQIVRDIRG